MKGRQSAVLLSMVALTAAWSEYAAAKWNTESPLKARALPRRFRPQYDVAFRAWLATKPFTNPHAPKGPAVAPDRARPVGNAEHLANAHYATGEHAASTSDRYIHITVILASPPVSVRWGLVGLGACLVVFAAIEILQLPAPSL